MLFDITRLQTYPQNPGVYLMKDVKGVILYIGKAKNLKIRLKQYFLPGHDDRIQVPFLMASVHNIETIIVETEKDALLLEARLIRRFKPKYNILLKDDRSRLMIRLGMEHNWPRIEYIRLKEVPEKPRQSYGPFSHTKDMFDLSVRLFQVRQCSDEEFKRRKSPCILHQIKKCSAPCVHNISHDEYLESIQGASDFLAGKMSWAREKLYRDMMAASDRLEFEKAQVLYERIQLLDQIASQRETDRVDGIVNADVIGIWHEGIKGLAISIAHYRQGFLQYSEGWVFDTSEPTEEISDMVVSLILQVYQERITESTVGHSYPLLDEILVPSLLEGSLGLLQEAISEVFNKKIQVKCPAIGPKMKIVRLASENAKARLLQKSNVKELMLDVLAEIAQELQLTAFPHVIDCFDASHFGGKGRVATCVSFQDGLPQKKRYRTFKIDESSVPNDLAMLQEALFRRYRDMAKGEDENALPNLIIIDGGKTQLRAAKETLIKLGLERIDLAALTKEAGRHDRGITKEKIYLPNRQEPIFLSEKSSLLHLLQRIRDEAHRFSIEFQKKQRSKNIRKSVLDDIPGIGPKKKEKILKAFPGIQALQKSTEEEVASKAKISLHDAKTVLETIKKMPS